MLQSPNARWTKQERHKKYIGEQTNAFAEHESGNTSSITKKNLNSLSFFGNSIIYYFLHFI